MELKRKQANLVISLHQFRNINLLTKGYYKLKIQVFTGKQYMNLSYLHQQAFENDKIPFFHNFSMKAQCHSDQQLTQQQTNRTKRSYTQYENKNTFCTDPFLIKYHCQKIKLNSIGFFTQNTDEQNAQIRITLYRKQLKSKSFSYFEPLESQLFKVKISNHFLQIKQILTASSQCYSIKMIILSCPIISYNSMYTQSQKSVIVKKLKQKQQINSLILGQLRKRVKKQRYQTFILSKQLSQIQKNTKKQIINLPSHFLQKQKSQNLQNQTNQSLFLKYLAFYQKYNSDSQMIKQETLNINFDKINIIKNFIESFEKTQLIISVLQQKQTQKNKKKYKHYIIQKNIQITQKQQLLKFQSQNQFKDYKSKLKQLQKCIYNENTMNQNVQQYTFVTQKPKKNKEPLYIFSYPILLREKFNLSYNQLSTSSKITVTCMFIKKTRKKKKYFIFSHGFQGLPVDLTFLVNMIMFTNQKYKILVLKSYKSSMGQCIQLMASKVAQQIKQFFQKIDLNDIQPEITFIGHSMGPIIMRAAFKQLKHLWEYFQSFISICSPHLGYIQGTKFLTETGLSLISKIKPIISLNQLSNRDNVNLQKTFIYNLSSEGSLKLFKKVILIACMDDDYVPWHSARIQSFSHQGQKSKIQKQMIQNIFGTFSSQSRLKLIERIQINFAKQKQKSLNSFIGRLNHIKPLNDRGFLEILTRYIITN